MNIFIYGSRRSGKTTEMIKWIKLFNNPVVMDGNYAKVREFERTYPDIKVYRDNKGIGSHTRVYDDFRTNSLYPVKFEHQDHNIITCTPDNTEDEPETEAYRLYQWCIENKWAVISLGCPHYNDKEVTMFNSYLSVLRVPGEIYGKWYNKELETLKVWVEKYSNRL